MRSVNSPQVCCIGEALVVLVAEQPGPLEDAATFSRSIGGAELNVAIGLEHCGIPTALLTRVGDDGFGRHLVESAMRQGVDVTAVEVDPRRATGLYVKERGGATALPTDLGRGNSRMHYFRAGSASSAFSPEYLRRLEVDRLLSGATLVHTTGITPALSASALAMTEELLLRKRSVQRISFDVNWRPQLWLGREAEGAATLARLAASADVVLIGASEALVLFDTAEPDEIRAALPGPRWLIVKNDGNAATGFDGDARVDVDAFAASVVEAIGAGDAFAAGFLAGLARERPLEQCLREAHGLALRALASTGDHVVAPAAGGRVVPPPPRAEPQ